MKIYIASSWKNEHAVEMLTDRLRARGHAVMSFVENNHGEGHGAEKPINFEEWVKTDQARHCFQFDTDGATTADLVIYLGPSGTDAWAEVGAAWASDKAVFGLWAKGEPVGLMRLMVTWFKDFRGLLNAVDLLAGLRGHGGTILDRVGPETRGALERYIRGVEQGRLRPRRTL